MSDPDEDEAAPELEETTVFHPELEEAALTAALNPADDEAPDDDDTVED